MIHINTLKNVSGEGNATFLFLPTQLIFHFKQNWCSNFPMLHTNDVENSNKNLI